MTFFPLSLKNRRLSWFSSLRFASGSHNMSNNLTCQTIRQNGNSFGWDHSHWFTEYPWFGATESMPWTTIFQTLENWKTWETIPGQPGSSGSAWKSLLEAFFGIGRIRSGPSGAKRPMKISVVIPRRIMCRKYILVQKVQTSSYKTYFDDWWCFSLMQSNLRSDVF